MSQQSQRFDFHLFNVVFYACQCVKYSDGARRRTSDIVRLTSPNVRLILVEQDKMSDSHLSKRTLINSELTVNVPLPLLMPSIILHLLKTFQKKNMQYVSADPFIQRRVLVNLSFFLSLFFFF